MSNLLGMPIIIGKRYRLNIRPNPEYRCGACNMMIEPPSGYTGAIVVIARVSSGTLRCSAEGSGCGGLFSVGEGFYVVEKPGAWRNFAVPYTWLLPLEDEDYAEDTP